MEESQEVKGLLRKRFNKKLAQRVSSLDPDDRDSLILDDPMRLKEDQIQLLGFGFVTFFSLVKHLMLFMTFMTILNIPLYVIYGVD